MSTITAAILGWILTTEAAAISGWSVRGTVAILGVRMASNNHIYYNSSGNIYMKSKNHYINYNSTSSMRARKKGTDGLVAS